MIKSILLSTMVLAFHTVASANLATEVKELYSKRERIENIDLLLSRVAQSGEEINRAEKAEKFQILYIYGRALYFKAMKPTDKDTRLALLDKSMQMFQKAREVQDAAETYFYFASALGRWAETKGVTASLGRKQEMMDNLNLAMQKVTLDGKSGQTVDGYGPNRVLGRMYMKLPFFAGGSARKARENLDVAFNKAPTFLYNILYRAELLNEGNSAEKAEACKMLAEGLKLDPQTLDADRIPENMEDFAELKKLNSQICN